jgi:hypothetical protein
MNVTSHRGSPKIQDECFWFARLVLGRPRVTGGCAAARSVPQTSKIAAIEPVIVRHDIAFVIAVWRAREAQTAGKTRLIVRRWAHAIVGRSSRSTTKLNGIEVAGSR